MICSSCESLLADGTTSCSSEACEEIGSPPNDFLVLDIESSLRKLFQVCYCYLVDVGVSCA